LEIVLPTKRSEVVSHSPSTFLLYAIPKAGKTTILSKLDDCLIINLEPNGANYVNAMKIDITESTPLQNIAKLKAVIAKIKDEGKPYKYIAIDTVTKLDELSEIAGTYKYMQKIQGKKFNRDSKGNPLMPDHPDFQTVHELPEGYGYRHSREWILDMYDQLSTLAEHVIFICHVKDKYVASKTGDAVQSIDINLTGKVKTIMSSRVDVVGYMFRKGKEAYISFEGTKDKTCGGRCEHLQGDILISSMDDEGEITTHWNKIYID
jgi:hypothetical protein